MHILCLNVGKPPRKSTSLENTSQRASVVRRCAVRDEEPLTEPGGTQRNSGRCCTQTVAVGPNVAESSDGEVAIRMKNTEDLYMRGLKVQEKTQLGWVEKSNG